MLESQEGKKVPEVIFKTRQNSEWKDVTTQEIFSGKTVIVFSLPGAFTPTCSSSHVPRYNELAKVFKKNGVDEIVCISVNDTFVMNSWKKDQNADKIVFIPDGNGEFTEKMGMLVNKGGLGFGKRSWRYSMLVKNNVIEKMFIEPEVEGDPYEVSDADTMLHYINPNAEKPKDITIFTKAGCPYCTQAKKTLSDKGFDYEEIILDHSISTRSLRAVSGLATTPQIFIEGKHIGGNEELQKYLNN